MEYLHMLSGPVTGEIVKSIRETVDKGRKFKPTLKSCREISNDLSKEVEETRLESERLEEIQRLQIRLGDIGELADEYSNLSWWNFPLFPHYQGKLQKKLEALQNHLSVYVPIENKRDLTELQSNVRRVREILENPKQPYLCGVPEEPEFVGMDKPLIKLKGDLLRDGVSVLVLTGLGGSGKTTLATKICWDPQIKGKFRDNIFFITVSKAPNLKTIVQRLFERRHEGWAPQFENDGDAAPQLQALLRSVWKSPYPMLLVLDDVGHSSEAFVDKFMIQIPDCKILVTSRVALNGFDTACQLDKLDHNDAVTLFKHFAQPNGSGSRSFKPDEKLIHEIVRACKGSPLVLQVTAKSLSQQPFEGWLTMKEQLSNSIWEADTAADLHFRLQQSLDLLGVKFSIDEKACFMDLGLFPVDQDIPATVLIDMWAALHPNIGENDWKAMNIIRDLTTRNLISVRVKRNVGTGEDTCYNTHFIKMHDFLRELAINESVKKPFEQREERLNIDLIGDDRPEWWIAQNQQGILGRLWSVFSRFLVGQKQLRVAARILSISTDDMFTSDWCDMQPDEAEVLVLNPHSSQYSLPEFTQKMSKLKALILTNYGFHHSELSKFELLGSLSNLKRVRLEKVSVPSLCTMKNLQKLSLHMCNTKKAFESSSIQISDALPNLVEMSIDYCKDLAKLPDGLCNITPLKKLSITNCHKLSALPQDIAKLENLEVLRLCSCSDLVEMPDSVGGLNKLRCLDISDCVSLAKLPDDIGDLKKLEKLYMKGCSKLSDSGLPNSVFNFEHVQHNIYVICDEERAASWKKLCPFLPNLVIEETVADTNLAWL